MTYEWDDAKDAANQVKHGVSFDEALAVFLDPALVIVPTIRAEDGEDRFKAIGIIEDRLFVVVFVMRGTACRLISARRTNAKEDRQYGNR